MKVDFHSHILPGIDDGSPDIDHTERMLRMEAEQGIETVIATPHFYAETETVESFLERRAGAYRRYLQLRKEKPELPELIPAAEVCYFEGIGRSDLSPYLCAAGSRVLFLESPFDQWSMEFYKDISGILNRRRMSVVLVHIERFLDFQKDPSVLNKVLELPVYLQVNANRFLSMGGRRTVRRILGFGKTTVIGSDCHNLHDRGPNMADASGMIGKKMKAEEKEAFETGEGELIGEITRWRRGGGL